MNTTLNEIKKCNPCKDGWEKLLNYLGKTKVDDEPLSFITILESNGIGDAIWSLRTHHNQNLVRVFAGRCAEHVLHIYESKYPNDDRPRKAVEVALRGDTDDDAATAAAYDAAATAAAAAAAYDAAYATAAAYDAAATAAAAAATAAAYDAATAAAYDAAATAAAAAAAYDAADAAYDVEREWQADLFIEMFKEV